MTAPLSQEARRAAALAFLAEETSAPAARDVLVEILQELSALHHPADPDNFFRTDGLPRTALRLRERNFAEWADLLEGLPATPRTDLPEAAGALHILVGQAAGKFCGRMPGEAEFGLVRSLRDCVPFSSRDFLEFAVKELDTRNDAKELLKATLNQRIADYPADPNRIAHILGRDRQHLASKQSENLRLADVWDDRMRRIFVMLHDPDVYELLRLTDRAVYLELVEEFPIREAIQDLVELSDRNAATHELCALLREARPVFDSNGEWIRQNRVAFLILNLLGQRLFQEVTEDPEPTEAFRSTLVDILNALQARADTTYLGYAWYQHLLMSYESDRRRRKLADGTEADLVRAMLSIATNLAFCLPAHPEPLKWIADEQDVWRNGRVCTLLAIEFCRQKQDWTAMADLIEKVASGDLVSSFGTERLLSNPKGGVERVVIANAIALIPNTAQWFHDLWTRLFWQRDRARGHRRTDHTLPNVGQAVAIWSAFALEVMEAGSGSAQALWIELEGAVRESYLTDFIGHHNDLWSQATRFLAAVWKRTFPNDPVSGTPGSLDDFIAPWIRINNNFVRLAAILHRYDVPPERLRQAGVSGDSLRLAVEDANVMGRSLLNEPEIVAINELADVLDGIGPAGTADQLG